MHRLRLGVIASLAVAVTSLAAACGSSSASGDPSLTTLKLGVNSPLGVVIAPLLYGNSVDLWKKYGLSIDMESATPSASVAALEGGSTDMTLDGLGLITEAAKTKNITIIGSDAIQYYNLIAKPSRHFRPIRTISDLKQFNGMTVGVTTPGSTIDTLMHSLAKKAGITLKFDYLSAVSPAIAVNNGIVDFAGATASNLSQPDAQRTQQLGDLSTLINGQGLYGVIGANKNWLSTHQKVAQMFAKAYAAAVKASAGDENGTVQAVATAVKTPTATSKIAYDLQKPDVFIKPFPTGEMNYDLATVYDQNPTVAKLRTSDIFDNDVLFNSDNTLK
jgi:ABC-type nitrate/sulfonate/bicarbonate transport system substrate-binding protein